ncbi:signal recognition particle 14kD protein-domain-containing protein, partial [Phyllosticta capitalensis]|uniref:signal recognition particle 14kD protein-domain-containing protein n=1 Tax=Phyllosticta capitalensis TaxID=121624 RepID=UPI0031321374
GRRFCVSAQFFDKLTDLFNSRRAKDHGSIYLTQKRLTYDALTSSSSTSTQDAVQRDPLWDTHPPSPLPVIVRATDGKSKPRRGDKVKLSTLVQPDALDAFYARYADVCKAGMTALKPRDRSKRKTQLKKRRKAGAGAAAAGPAEGKS